MRVKTQQNRTVSAITPVAQFAAPPDIPGPAGEDESLETHVSPENAGREPAVWQEIEVAIIMIIMEENRPPSKKNPLAFGVVLIFVGILVIVGRYVDLGGMSRLWPLFLMIPVVPLTITLANDPKKNAESLIPVISLTVLCLYFLWLNYSDWSNVTKSWPIFILAPGLGVLGSWVITRERRQLVSAAFLLGLGLLMFLRNWLDKAGVRVDRYLVLGILLMLIGVGIIIARTRKGRGSGK